MGHGHSKNRFEIERIIKEVKDTQSYIRKNCEEFDDKCRENLHRRLIEYSQLLQDVFVSVDKKNSKECKDATKLIASVIDELYQQRHLDTGAVETNSFIHVTGKDAKLWSPSQSNNKDKRQADSKAGTIPQGKYSLPSLEDIKNKTASLKRNIDNYIKNDEINQLIVEQKIVQILATDLEMIFCEEYSPLQETKKGLEKDLSLMYRKIERAKRRHNDATQSRQKELRDSISKLTQINSKIEQIINRAHNITKSDNLSELISVRNEIVDSQQKMDTVTMQNEEVLRIKSEIAEKISSIQTYLDTERITLLAPKGNEKTESLGDTSNKLIIIKNISSDVDHCMKQAKVYFKEEKREDLVKLKHEILKSRSILREYNNCDDILVALPEVEAKIKNTLKYLETCIERTNINKKSLITKENLEKAYNLINDCRDDILKFDENTCQADYDTYSKHLEGLETFLSKIVINDKNITKRKEECIKNLLNCHHILQDKFENFKDKLVPNVTDNNSRDNFKRPRASEITDRLKEAQCDTNIDGKETIVLRKPFKLPKFNDAKTVDGFYVYWRELQSNLPSYNCSFSELTQVARLLNDIEQQVRQKRINIENLLCTKKNTDTLATMNSPNQIQIKTSSSHEAITNVVKTNARIYKLNEPTQIFTNNNDDQMIQSVDEIKENSKKVLKQSPERVFLTSDNSITDSVIPRKVDENHQDKRIKDTVEGTTKTEKISNNFTKLYNREHVEHISQVQNIACSVQYLKEKAIRFGGSKQSPQYADMKSKLDSYRRTLNILISYQNENITLSCNRVMTSIDEVIEILNSNTEQLIFKFPQPTSIKRSTIEEVFKEIIEMKSRLDDIEKTIDAFQETEENAIYQSICDELLNNRNILNEIKINSNYEVILNSKMEVFRQINDNLFNLDSKLQENRLKQRNAKFKNMTKDVQELVKEIQKMKDKVERFSGTYKNVVYKEIEKGILVCLNNAEMTCNDKGMLEDLKTDAKTYLKILEQKAIKEYSDSSEKNERSSKFKENKSHKIVEDVAEDIAIQLSNLKQHYKEIQNKVHTSEALTAEANVELSQTIDSKMAQLNSIKLTSTEPFYLDTENLKQDFLKLSKCIKERILSLECHRTPADGESVSQTSTLKTAKNDIVNAISSIEKNLEFITAKIQNFANEKASADFFNLDEALTRLSMNIDKISVTKGTDLHKKKMSILKNIHACCETLENQAQSYEILQNVDKKINEVKYRLENFHNLSSGDYSALHKELTDLDVTLKDLTVSGKIAEKMLTCQINIHQCLDTIEGKYVTQNVTDSDSDDGTSV